MAWELDNMGYVTVRTHHCPLCNRCVDPVLGLIVKPFVACRSCRTRVYVSADMVISNWSRNFYLLSALLIWAGLVAVMAVVPQHDMSPGRAALSMVLIGWLLGLVCALPLLPVGHVLGHVVAWFVAHGPPRQGNHGSGLRYGTGRVPQDHEWR